MSLKRNHRSTMSKVKLQMLAPPGLDSDTIIPHFGSALFLGLTCAMSGARPIYPPSAIIFRLRSGTRPSHSVAGDRPREEQSRKPAVTSTKPIAKDLVMRLRWRSLVSVAPPMMDAEDPDRQVPSNVAQICTLVYPATPELVARFFFGR